MPANMMSDAVGSAPKVRGRRRAMAAAGPMPGRTPTSWPRNTPRKHIATFMGLRAVTKPPARSLSASMSNIPRGQGQRYLEPVLEDESQDGRGAGGRKEGTKKR